MGMSVDAAQITVDQMLDIADRELRRLQLAQGTIYWHCRELRDFADYCVQNAIQIYRPDTGITYFFQRYGMDMTDPSIKLNEKQRTTRGQFDSWMTFTNSAAPGESAATITGCRSGTPAYWRIILVTVPKTTGRLVRLMSSVQS